MTIVGRAALFFFCAIAVPAVAFAAQTTGTLLGTVTDSDGRAIASATIQLVSASLRQTLTTDARGRFTIVDVVPDRYDVQITAAGMQPADFPVSVLPGRTSSISVRLLPLATITTVRSIPQRGVHVGSPTNLYTLDAAQARAPLASLPSGLSQYAEGTAQGAAARAPGVQEDQFANALVRDGRTNDTLYLYDGVPVAQALIAEPGGNVIGAQLPTTGVAFTNVYVGGFSGPDAALGGIVDQIPLRGVSPAKEEITVASGTPSAAQIEASRAWATNDLRQRYAVDVRSSTTAFSYGDGRTFYPAEAATYGLALASRAAWSASFNAGIQTGKSSELELDALSGSSVSDQYGTPIAGLFAPFTSDTPSRIRGTFDVFKGAMTWRSHISATTASLYTSSYHATTNAPFFDDLSFPNGVISYFGSQAGALQGLRVETHVLPNSREELSYGVDAQAEQFTLHQTIAQLEDGNVDANPSSNQYVAYAQDTWHVSPRIDLMGAFRALAQSSRPGTTPSFHTGAIDPHASLVYDTGHDALRFLYDRVSVPPRGLELALAATPLSTERSSSTEVSYEHQGRGVTRLTYFNRQERNRIDLLPLSGSIEIPQNTGALNVHGFEFSYARGAVTFAASDTRGVSSSAEQFAINELNGAAIAAGHLFPLGYVPDVTALMTIAFRSRVVTIAPELSWESGYPYGNGRSVWIFGTDGKPQSVPNDNHINPGYSYYFLRDPSAPYDPLTNPYIGSLGTPERDDPNTLHTPPQLLASLHVEAPIRSELRAVLDVANIFGTASPTQLQGNPYLIGPPGYAGGNARYSSWYGAAIGSGRYVVGNGVPTTDGVRQALPWTYGTDGYVASSYPQARSFLLRLEWSI